jgi:hypothetical protein
MADTFSQMYRELMLYCPFVPLPLAEHWIRNRWRKVCEARHWSFLRAGGTFAIPAVYNTGTITMTNGSTTVTGSGTAWTTAMEERQLKVSNYAPVLTITDVTGPTTLTIDQPWYGAASTGTSYQILQAYVTVPTDFLTFVSVNDVQNRWRLWVNYFDTTYLDSIDPQRSSSGNPYLLASFRHSLAGLPRFEMWPHPVTLSQYPYIYIKRTADITDSYTLPHPITGDMLVRGAQADLCRWPGTENQKNPMFRLDLAQSNELEFQAMLSEAFRQDNEIYARDLSYSDNYPAAPLDAAFAQSHAMAELPVNRMF